MTTRMPSAGTVAGRLVRVAVLRHVVPTAPWFYVGRAAAARALGSGSCSDLPGAESVPERLDGHADKMLRALDRQVNIRARVAAISCIQLRVAPGDDVQIVSFGRLRHELVQALKGSA